jgi:hypothetical protein
MSLRGGHVPSANIQVVPISPRAKRRIGLVRLKGKQDTEGVKLVTKALLTLRERVRPGWKTASRG